MFYIGKFLLLLLFIQGDSVSAAAFSIFTARMNVFPMMVTVYTVDAVVGNTELLSVAETGVDDIVLVGKTKLF